MFDARMLWNSALVVAANLAVRIPFGQVDANVGRPLLQGAAARAADEAAKVLGAKMKRDGSRSAMRSALLTIAGGVGLSIAVRAATGSAPLEHPLMQVGHCIRPRCKHPAVLRNMRVLCHSVVLTKRVH